jgi:ArsR family transcriptional regulator
MALSRGISCTPPAEDLFVAIDPASDNHVEPSPRALPHFTQMLSLLADETRLRMVMALAQDGELDVTAMVALVGRRQPLVSHNLALLRLAGLVSYREEGTAHLYRLEWGTLRYVLRRFFAAAGHGRQELRLGDYALEFLQESVEAGSRDPV